ncbi:hypothetical protein CKO28_17505 [Rhodovibrio sodomensis]|uniref:Uncharacterized protein n=1 Tax=Rhodovibrio sodomensis TaxID=1088 RepID=A0ABS1DH91_9PROT|nr:hypothetical protein [Rhodovibrio sodomensis]MBK1669835.1 hypothetical protein [Rhodovibrio sodomensis]
MTEMEARLTPAQKNKLSAARDRSARRLREAGLLAAAAVIEARLRGDEPQEIDPAIFAEGDA